MNIQPSNMTMGDWQNKISTWAESTFKHTERGIAIHLLREAVELCRAAGIETEELWDITSFAVQKTFGLPEKQLGEEAADVTILVLALAGHAGFDLEMAVEAKHAVNTVRTWGQPDAQGITEHVEN